MNTKTKNIFIASIIVSVFTSGALFLFFNEIRQQGKLLEQQITMLTDNNNKQSSSVRTKRLVQETEEERSLLTSSFFKNEGDSISFLSEIEALAKNSGLTLRTEALDKVIDPATKRESIKIMFVYEGQKELVYNFSKLMENIPYHAKVEALSLRQLAANSGMWEGRLTDFITLNPL